ncbi:MAG: hypothetical protein ABIH04_07250, partial [Planctomycetota bacterium]
HLPGSLCKPVTHIFLRSRVSTKGNKAVLLTLLPLAGTLLEPGLDLIWAQFSFCDSVANHYHFVVISVRDGISVATEKQYSRTHTRSFVAVDKDMISDDVASVCCDLVKEVRIEVAAVDSFPNRLKQEVQ